MAYKCRINNLPVIMEIMKQIIKTVVADTEAAKLRCSEFIVSIPKEVIQKEGAIKKKLSSENASSRSKLRKIYNLVTELMNSSGSYTACKKGCSSCCKMNVMISQEEARYIEKNTGIKFTKLASSIIHNQDKFISVPCPFLKIDTCSIYDSRPLACRQHVSFDSTSYWCDPERLAEVEFSLVKFSGAEDALMEVSKITSGGVLADIRDFFPAT